MRENTDLSFGNIDNRGQYNGVMGELQREEADFCLLLAPNARRLQAIDYLRLEPTDYVIVLSKKPSLLPAVMSFIRPFSSTVRVVFLDSLSFPNSVDLDCSFSQEQVEVFPLLC